MGNDCNLKYPLLMVHGMGFRDRKHLCYWGRVPKALESEGANVFFGHQDAVGSVEGNAEIIARSLDEVLRITGAEKVNILAHSKGGLESRYLANHGYKDKIASITTIDTPHHGSKTVDFLMRAPKWMVKTAAKGNDIWMKMAPRLSVRRAVRQSCRNTVHKPMRTERKMQNISQRSWVFRKAR